MRHSGIVECGHSGMIRYIFTLGATHLKFLLPFYNILVSRSLSVSELGSLVLESDYSVLVF